VHLETHVVSLSSAKQSNPPKNISYVPVRLQAWAEKPLGCMHPHQPVPDPVVVAHPIAAVLSDYSVAQTVAIVRTVVAVPRYSFVDSVG
jgi:hypothetical protein